MDFLVFLPFLVQKIKQGNKEPKIKSVKSKKLLYLQQFFILSRSGQES